MHLVFFLAVVKVLTAKTSRDHLYTAVIAFLELVAAAILSVNFNFFLFLALYLLFAMAALTSGEIRRSMNHAGVASTARYRVETISSAAGGAFRLRHPGNSCHYGRPLLHPAAHRRRRLLPAHFASPAPAGFSNQVNLGEIGEIKTTSRPVMHIRHLGSAAGAEVARRRAYRLRRQALVESQSDEGADPRLSTERPQLSPFGDRAGRPQARTTRSASTRSRPTRCSSPVCRKAFSVSGPELLSRTEGGGYRLGQPPRPGLPLRGVQPARGGSRDRAADVPRARAAAAVARALPPTADAR